MAIRCCGTISVTGLTVGGNGFGGFGFAPGRVAVVRRPPSRRMRYSLNVQMFAMP